MNVDSKWQEQEKKHEISIKVLLISLLLLFPVKWVQQGTNLLYHFSLWGKTFSSSGQNLMGDVAAGVSLPRTNEKSLLQYHWLYYSKALTYKLYYSEAFPYKSQCWCTDVNVKLTTIIFPGCTILLKLPIMQLQLKAKFIVFRWDEPKQAQKRVLTVFLSSIPVLALFSQRFVHRCEMLNVWQDSNRQVLSPRSILPL